MNDEIDWSKLDIQTSSIKFYTTPQPNWKVYFGDNPDICYQFYTKNPPNRFQRWMIKKILNISWEPMQ